MRAPSTSSSAAPSQLFSRITETVSGGQGWPDPGCRIMGRPPSRGGVLRRRAGWRAPPAMPMPPRLVTFGIEAGVTDRLWIDVHLDLPRVLEGDRLDPWIPGVRAVPGDMVRLVI